MAMLKPPWEALCQKFDKYMKLLWQIHVPTLRNTRNNFDKCDLMALLRPLWEALLPHCWTHGPHCPPDCHRHCSRQFSTKADTRLRIALKRSWHGSGNVEKVMLGRRRLDSEWPDQNTVLPYKIFCWEKARLCPVSCTHMCKQAHSSFEMGLQMLREKWYFGFPSRK